ncbi:alpha-1,2-fucosyltransferase [Marinitoga arctica]
MEGIENNTKFVKFKGGLGNQLFQYSFMRRLNLIYNFKVKADMTFFENIKNDNIRVPRIFELNVKLEIATKKELENIFKFNNNNNNNNNNNFKSLKYKFLITFEALFNRKYYFEKNRNFRNIDKIKNYTYFDGYWQSWRYLEGIENFLKKEIKLKNEMSMKNKNYVEKISNEESVFIGVRRGDYVSSKKVKKHYGTFDESYYNKAIDVIKQGVKNPKFYVFSNDINWVKNNMRFNEKVIFREKEEQTTDLEELFVLSSFKHAIIVNSTFYWWGAWLINNKNKIIIAPKKWFGDDTPIDIIPPNWIKMTRDGEVVQ